MAKTVPEQNKGLMVWARSKGASKLAGDLEGKDDIDDPKALAVWLRKKAIGERAFKAHQKAAREGRGD
jgi:hypothetical protein